jgi:hypothetical protein
VTEKIWLYDDEKKKVFTVSRDDPRLVLGWRDAPEGNCVWFAYREHPTMDELHSRHRWQRRKARDKWRFLHYGTTEAELCERVNARVRQLIANTELELLDAQKRIDALRGLLLKPKG